MQVKIWAWFVDRSTSISLILCQGKGRRKPSQQLHLCQVKKSVSVFQYEPKITKDKNLMSICIIEKAKIAPQNYFK